MISNLQSEFEDSTDINFTLINGLKAKSSGVEIFAQYPIYNG